MPVKYVLQDIKASFNKINESKIYLKNTDKKKYTIFIISKVLSLNYK